MPVRPTPKTALPTPVRLAALLVALFAVAVVAAPAASAVVDPTRPDVSVTRGPSCRPGGVEFQVVAGTAAYSVVLATTRRPGGEDAATLAPGQTVLLRTGDAAWGETIDSRLEFTALDASGVSYVDELEPYSFTRPSEEDCAAIAAPAAGAPAVNGPALPAVDAPADDDAAVPAAGGALTDSTGGATDVAVTPVSAARPVPTPSPRWPALVAGGALLAAASGVAGVGLRRRSAHRDSVPSGSA